MLSYAILVYNEVKQIEQLLKTIKPTLLEEDEIVILQDSNADTDVKSKIKLICDKYEVDVYKESSFDGNFAKRKNDLNSLCSNSWIVNLDADELVTENFNQGIKELILKNGDIDSIQLPRINIIDGASDEFLEVQKKMPGYGWIINEHNHINFPDYQCRVYKNNGSIRWEGDVHEQILGSLNASAIPADYQFHDFFLRHPKQMSRQFLQNYKYLNIIEDDRFKKILPDVNLFENYQDVEFPLDINDIDSETIILISYNDDYELGSVEFDTNKRIIWITHNISLYSTLGYNKNIERYFLKIDQTPKNSEYFFSFVPINNSNDVRLIYTLNSNKISTIIKDLFNPTNYVVL